MSRTLTASEQQARLRLAIDDIGPRHDALPAISGSGADGWIQAHAARRQHASALADHIRHQHGGRIGGGQSSAHRMQLHGITVTCTSGLCGAIGAWLTKARRQLAALERETTP